MMSLETIHRLNAEVAVEAAEHEQRPFVITAEELDYCPPFPIPNLGYLEPDGWEKTDAVWFVDKTGHGHEWEPALTVEQFKRELRAYIAEHPSHGFGIVEEGECQVYVGAFRPLGGE